MLEVWYAREQLSLCLVGNLLCYHAPYMEDKDAVISKIDIGGIGIDSNFHVYLCGKNQLESQTPAVCTSSLPKRNCICRQKQTSLEETEDKNNLLNQVLLNKRLHQLLSIFHYLYKLLFFIDTSAVFS